MRHVLILALLFTPSIAPAEGAAQAKPNLQLEVWRAYAMALEGLTENQLREVLINAHYDYLAQLDACQEGMAHPSCADRVTAGEIARLRTVTNGTLPDDAAIGPLAMDCAGLPKDSTLTLIWGETPFAVIQSGQDMRVLEGIAGSDGAFAGQSESGEDTLQWTGTEAKISLAGAAEVTCNVMIGED